MDEHQGEQRADHEPERLADGADEAGLDQNGAPHLPGLRARQAQQPQLLPPLQHEREHGGGHARHGHEHGDDLQRPGDGEGAVKDAQHLGAQAGIGEHGDKAAPVQGGEHFLPHGPGVGARLQVQGQVRGAAGAEVFLKQGLVQGQGAAIAGVIIKLPGHGEGARPLRRGQLHAAALPHAEAQGEALGDEDLPLFPRALEQRLRVAGRLEDHAPVLHLHGEVARAELHDAPLVGQVQGAVAIRRGHGGVAGQQIQRLLGKRGRALAARGGAGAHIQVRAHALIHPQQHRLAEAAHHDGDGHRQRQAHRQRRHGNGEPPRGRADLRGRQPPLNAEHPPQRAAQHPRRARQHRPHPQRHGGDGAEAGAIAPERQPIHRRSQSRRIPGHRQQQHQENAPPRRCES